jgi:hypothetical protein
MGLDYRSHLLLHAGSCDRAWFHRLGSIYAISGLRLIPHAGNICDLGILRLVKKQEGDFGQIGERRSDGKANCSLLGYRVSVLPIGERVSFASQGSVYRP